MVRGPIDAPLGLALGVPGVEPAVARHLHELELAVAVEIADRRRRQRPAAVLGGFGRFEPAQKAVGMFEAIPPERYPRSRVEREIDQQQQIAAAAEG